MNVKENRHVITNKGWLFQIDHMKTTTDKVITHISEYKPQKNVYVSVVLK